MIRPSRLWDSSGRQSFAGLAAALAVALGTARILGGLAALVWLASQPLELRDEGALWIHLLQSLVFAAAGIFLYRRGGDDLRARLFGCVFILIASASIQTPIWMAAKSQPPQLLMYALTLVAGLRPEVYLPFFFWLAVERFPERTASPPLQKTISFGLLVSFAVGSWYFLLGLSRLLIRFLHLAVPDPIDRITGTYRSFWTLILPLVLLALPVFLIKLRQLGKSRRGRGGLYAGAASHALARGHRLLDAIDRRFFRERHDARRVLTALAEQVRGTRDLGELSKLLERGFDLALHLERVSLLTGQPGAGRFVDPRQQVRPLDAGSRLMTLIAGRREPIAVDLESPRSPFLSLPEEDKLWLIESRAEMIAPLHSIDGNPIGLLALGPKRSELPFLREDRDLIAGVAASAGLVIELLGPGQTAAPVAAASLAAAAEGDTEPAAAGPEDTALECIACDRVYPPGSSECPHCHVDLEKTSVPFILRDLYRLDSRLGVGGMAVVYRAKDLKLGRAVAIKTLPRVNAEAAMRLRREARTAASVSHPGLAAIYGLETWRGVPMIITELLAGGTLADQLHHDPLEPLAAIDMARTIAQALAKLHTAGILHRDVKPSNIGYTEDGQVKLLDFGIARIQQGFRPGQPDSDASTGADRRSRIVNTASAILPRTRTGQLVGTVTYLSPEAARGEKPDPGVDLWALAVCLHESLTAENLFYGRSFQEVLDQIRDLRIPDVRTKAPACPEPLALFLARELDLDRSRRAEHGLEMANRLDQVRAKILAV